MPGKSFYRGEESLKKVIAWFFSLILSCVSSYFMWKSWVLNFRLWSQDVDNVSIAGTIGFIGFDCWIVFNIMLHFTIVFFAYLHLNREKLSCHDVFIGREDTIVIKIVKIAVYLFLAFSLIIIFQDAFYRRWYDFIGQILVMPVALSYSIWFSAISRGRRMQKTDRKT